MLLRYLCMRAYTCHCRLCMCVRWRQAAPELLPYEEALIERVSNAVEEQVGCFGAFAVGCLHTRTHVSLTFCVRSWLDVAGDCT